MTCFHLVQRLVDLGGHSHMFCFFPEKGSLMDHLPATPRDQWRRVQLGRYLIDYCGVRVGQMKFDEAGRVIDFGLPKSELDATIDSGIAFRTSGCPGKFAEDISACDRPYGDSPPSDIASYPFALADVDIRKVRGQLGMDRPGESYVAGEEFEGAGGRIGGGGERMARQFRVIDTGVRPCREQMAFDQALIDNHKAGLIGDTIRFLQFPPSVLVGRHQALSHELNLDACRQAGVGIGRRITGGGALYLDEGQFGWELVFHRDTLAIANLGELAREICEAAAHGLSKLGIEARYRPRNDIEVEGRKISGTGGFFDGSTIFYQGTTLVDMDGARMASLLNIPAAKLAKRGQTSGAQRVVTLNELFAGNPPPIGEVKQALLEGFSDRLGIIPEPGEIGEAEEETARAVFDEEIGGDDFVYSIGDPNSASEVFSGSHTGAGGTISAHVRLEGPRQNRVREIVVTGDFFVTPPRTVLDLEAALRGVALGEVEDRVLQFFNEAEVGLLTAAPADFIAAIRQAVPQMEQAGSKRWKLWQRTG